MLFNEYKLRNITNSNVGLLFYVRGIRSIFRFYLSHPRRLVIETFGSKYFMLQRNSPQPREFHGRSTWIGRSASLSGWSNTFSGLDFEHERFRSWHNYEIFLFGTISPRLENWRHRDVQYEGLTNVERQDFNTHDRSYPSLVIKEFNDVKLLNGQFIESDKKIFGILQSSQLNSKLLPDRILNYQGIVKISKPIHHSDNNFRVLYCGQNNNYFHFVTEILTVLMATTRSGVSFEKLAIEANLPSQFYDFVRFLFPNDLIFVQAYSSLSIKDLVFAFKNTAGWELPESHTDEIRELQVYIREKLDFSDPQSKYVFVSRANNLYRPLKNRNTLQNISKRYGFHIIDPSTLTFLQQAKIFSSANVVVAESGAAMTNLIFCKPGTKILEIQPFKGKPGFWRSYSEILGLVHFEIQGKPSRLAFNSYISDRYRISPEKFTKLLETVIK